MTEFPLARGAMMLESPIGTETRMEFDDIECELCCSTREASVGCIPMTENEPWRIASSARSATDARKASVEGGEATGRSRLYKAPR